QAVAAQDHQVQAAEVQVDQGQDEGEQVGCGLGPLGQPSAAGQVAQQRLQGLGVARRGVPALLQPVAQGGQLFIRDLARLGGVDAGGGVGGRGVTGPTV